MASVQDIVECPQCKGVYITDFNCHTQEEFRACMRCGLRETWELERDENGKTIYDKDGHTTMKYTKNMGYGSLRIAFKTGVAQTGAMLEPITDKDKEEYLKWIEEPEINKEDCYLVAWDSEKNDVVVIFGTMPQTYEEFWDNIGGETSTDEQS